MPLSRFNDDGSERWLADEDSPTQEQAVAQGWLPKPPAPAPVAAAAPGAAPAQKAPPVADPLAGVGSSPALPSAAPPAAHAAPSPFQTSDPLAFTPLPVATAQMTTPPVAPAISPTLSPTAPKLPPLAQDTATAPPAAPPAPSSPSQLPPSNAQSTWKPSADPGVGDGISAPTRDGQGWDATNHRWVDWGWLHPVADASGLFDWTGANTTQLHNGLTETQVLAANKRIAGGDDSTFADYHPQAQRDVFGNTVGDTPTGPNATARGADTILNGLPTAVNPFATDHAAGGVRPWASPALEKNPDAIPTVGTGLVTSVPADPGNGLPSRTHPIAPPSTPRDASPRPTLPGNGMTATPDNGRPAPGVPSLSPPPATPSLPPSVPPSAPPSAPSSTPPPPSDPRRNGGLNGLPATSGNPVSFTPYTGDTSLTNYTISPGAGVDRYGLAHERFNAWRAETDPAYLATMRDANRYSAAAGRIGSGQATNSIGDIETQRENAMRSQETKLFGDALEGSINDAWNSIGLAERQQAFQKAMQETGFAQNIDIARLSDSEQAQAFSQAMQQLLIGYANDPSAVALILAQIFGGNADAAAKAAQGYYATQQPQTPKTTPPYSPPAEPND